MYRNTKKLSRSGAAAQRLSENAAVVGSIPTQKKELFSFFCFHNKKETPITIVTGNARVAFSLERMNYYHFPAISYHLH